MKTDVPNARTTGSIALDSKIALWITRKEGLLLAAILLCYAVVLFGVYGEVPICGDNPGYTDPAVRYVTGHGFTSTCWYSQGKNALWAGNVPLHEFLLVPWLKLFGVSYNAVLRLNFLYVAAGMILLWRAVIKSGFVRTAPWRLGLIAFLLSTDASAFLLTFGRPDPLSFLLIACTACLLTAEPLRLRLGGLFAIAALLPWAQLTAAVYAGVVGGLMLLFYPKRFWKEVFAFGSGGVLGTLLLAAFYRHFGVWDAFLTSIAPHMANGALQSAKYFQPHRMGGLSQAFLLRALAPALLVLLIVGAARKRWRFPLFAAVCMVMVPLLLIKVGVFALYSGWLLLFLVTGFVFSMLSGESALERRSPWLVLCILLLATVIPGSFARRAIKNRLALRQEGSPSERVEAFLDQTLHPDDVGWISEQMYYVAMPKIRTVFSSPLVFADFGGALSYPGRDADLASITVLIWDPKNLGNPDRFKKLSGEWKPTGEHLTVGNTDLCVYRRTGAPLR